MRPTMAEIYIGSCHYCAKPSQGKHLAHVGVDALWMILETRGQKVERSGHSQISHIVEEVGLHVRPDRVKIFI